MERRKFTREFKLEAVRLIKDRGVSYVQASQDLGVHPSQLRDWVKHGRPPRMVYRLKHRDVIDADLNSIREVASLALVTCARHVQAFELRTIVRTPPRTASRRVIMGKLV
jgi:transposase